jgi:carbonic anhydrase/acetyltransferase-like protein (isoleucine patch superfamily)
VEGFESAIVGAYLHNSVGIGLEQAILEASKAGQWAVVAMLARELEARRLSAAVGAPSNIVPFGAKRGAK